jgi:hypothetical protein
MKMFGELLTKYMRRVRAGVNDVAEAIGSTRQSLYNWQKGAMPNKKNRDKIIACAQFLRLTRQETQEFLEAAKLSEDHEVGENLAGNIFLEYIQKLFNKLSSLSYPFMVLLNQASWNEPPARNTLLIQAKQKYGAENVLVIQPPFSPNADVSRYFSTLAQQCQFDDIKDDSGFEWELRARLDKSVDPVFLLISRFEQGEQSLRERLAGILHNLSDEYEKHLHVILCGGEKLAELYYSQTTTLLDYAIVEHWQELGVAEVKALCQYRFPTLQSTDKVVEKLLILSGGHPTLLHFFLEIKQQAPKLPLDDYPDKLLRENEVWKREVWKLFTPFTRHNETRQQVYEWLQQEDLGKAQPFIFDDLLRQLYWKNLLVEREINGEKRLLWRCQALREIGKNILKP